MPRVLSNKNQWRSAMNSAISNDVWEVGNRYCVPPTYLRYELERQVVAATCQFEFHAHDLGYTIKVSLPLCYKSGAYESVKQKVLESTLELKVKQDQALCLP